MALQGEKAELAQAVLDVAKTAFRWGVIPAIIYFGAEGRWQRRMRDSGEERNKNEDEGEEKKKNEEERKKKN